MKTQDILYLIFTALILAYPLYEDKFVKEIYRTKIVYFVYTPLAIVCLVIIIWTLVSSRAESDTFFKRLTKQESSTKSLVAESLKISSFEIRTRYRYEYKDELSVQIEMKKGNPIKAYIVNTEVEKDSISFINDSPKIYYPNKKTLEFNFNFSPEEPAKVYGQPLKLLEKYESIYFPWKSFTHFLALLKVGGKSPELATEPILFFQIIINSRVFLEQKEIIKDIESSSVVLIYKAEPEIFKDIEIKFLDS